MRRSGTTDDWTLPVCHGYQKLSMTAIAQPTLFTTSWDDGHALDFRIADLLEKYGVAGTFYIPRTAPRGVMNTNQIRELSRRFEIGAHTLDHVYLNRVSDAVAVEQLSGSRQWIEEVTGTNCRVFCFPGGTYRTRQLPLVRAAGFLAARTVELLSIRPPAPAKSVFLMPTTIQAFPHGVSAYVKNAIRRARNIFALHAWDLLQARDWVGLAECLFDRALQLRGVFHLWGHSWEIEEHGQWENLERFLAMVSRRETKPCLVTNGELCQAALSEHAKTAKQIESAT